MPNDVTKIRLTPERIVALADRLLLDCSTEDIVLGYSMHIAVLLHRAGEVSDDVVDETCDALRDGIARMVRELRRAQQDGTRDRIHLAWNPGDRG